MRIIAILLILIFSLNSCKKKNPSTPAPAPSPTAPTSYPSGLLEATYVYRDYMGVVNPVDSFVSAIFCTDSLFTTVNLVNAGVVKFNDTIIPFFINGYSKTANVFGNYVWSTSGTSIFPAFTYTFTHPFPAYTGGSLLPDTVSRSNGLYVPVTNKFNYSSMYVEMPLDVSNTIHSYNLINDSIKLAPQIWNNYYLGGQRITLVFIKQTYALVNNCRYRFSSILRYDKFIYLKP